MKLKKVAKKVVLKKKPKLKKVVKSVPLMPKKVDFKTNLTCEWKNNFPNQPKMVEYSIISSVSELKWLCNEMSKLQAFAFDTETNTLEVLGDNKDFKCVGISMSWGEEDTYYIPLGHIREEDIVNQIYLDTVVEYLKPIFEQIDIRIYGWNLKFDFHVLKRLGITIYTRNVFDGMLASWLCNENTPNGLKENSSDKMNIAQTHFKEATSTVPNEIKKQYGFKANANVPFDLVLIEDGAPYACSDAFYTWCLCLGYEKELEAEKMDKIFYKMYMPFMFVLFEMEERGVTVDIDKLEQMGEDMQKDLDDLQYKIYELAGVEFNINSNQQKAEILFGYEKEPKEANYDKLPKYVQKAVDEENYDILDEKGLFISHGKLMQKANSNEEVLNHSFNFSVISATKSGAPSTDNDTIWRLSKKTYKNKNSRKMQGVKMCEYMLDYSKLSKLKTAFVDGILEQIYADGKVHPNFNQIGTDSGRLSCIAEDTEILCVGEKKKIQDVKVGDLVYCYDEEGNVRVRKVLNVFDNGYRECVNVQYRSQGTHEYGNLICTPDHKIRMRSGEWVEAQKLSTDDRVAHIRKSNEDRPRLYGVNSFCEKEQVLIKREVFGCDDSNIVIHHKDHIKSNNSLDNLVLMSKEEHTSYHSKDLLSKGRIKWEHLKYAPRNVKSGADNPNYIHFTKEELENMVREAKGRITNIPMDFETFKKKCADLDFDYKKIAGEYQTQYRNVSDEEFIEAFFECKGVPYAIHKKLNIGRVKVANIIKRLDLCYNHKVETITPCGVHHVYDLEVEDYHNFIANEVCVHNCSKPNLQQLPKAEEEDKYQIRSVFIGSIDENTNKRKHIIAIDYHNLEMVCLTHFSDDKNLSEMFANDDDAHGSTAVNMFNLDCTPVECKKKYPHLRQAAKTINFMLMYGGGASALYDSLRFDHYSPLDLGDKEYLEKYRCNSGVKVAQAFIDKYFESYSGVAKFIQSQRKYAHRNGYVYTILGRKRRLPDINSRDSALSSYSERLAVNSTIQGTAGDITINAQLRVADNERLKDLGCNMLIQVHDELVFECPEENLEEAISIIKPLMEHPFGDSKDRQVKYLRADYDTGLSYQEAK